MPKSKILKKGYINQYSRLTPQENRQFNYNCLYKTINRSWDNSHVALSAKLKEFAKTRDNLKLFDAGCGHGNYLVDENRPLISFAAGMDISHHATAKNICLDEIKYGNLEKIPYKNNTFDIIVSLWLFEHLANPNLVFTEFKRILKPGGLLLAATPNANCYLIKLKKIFNQNSNNRLVEKLYGRKEDDIFPTFYRANTIKSLNQLLGLAGFGNISVTPNYDPGYTSFNQATFLVSNCLNHTLGRLLPQFYRSHLLISAVA